MTDPMNQNPNPNPESQVAGTPDTPQNAPNSAPTAPTTPPNMYTPTRATDAPTSQDTRPTSDADWGGLSSGDAVLDGAIKAFTASAGMSPQDFMQIVGNAVDYNDPELIDKTLLSSKYAGTEDTIKGLVNALIAQANNADNMIRNTAYQIAGGKESWDQAVAIFNANAPAYLKETVKTMIDNGKIKEGAQMLMNSVGSYGQGASSMPQMGGGMTPQKGLSFDELKVELGKLVQEAGGASLESGTYGRRYQDLMKRRAIGRQQGI